ncbi:MAG: ComEC/Rec2 family competence protein [Bacteroidota bacterium]
MNWKQYPFIKLFLPFSLGIACALNRAVLVVIPFLWIVLLFLICSIGIFLANHLISYRYRWLPGILITAFLFVSGFALCCLQNESNQPTHFSKIISDKNLYIINITEPPEEKENSIKVVARIDKSLQQSKWANCSGSMVIYIQKDSTASNLQYGDVLMIHTTPSKIKPPQNPSEFNYQRYLAHKNIFQQCYLKHNEWQRIASGKGEALKAFATSLRQKLLKIFEVNHVSGKEYAVISAILLGQTDKIDPELIKEYSGSGAIHVLSVSGMHVGLIFISLSVLLGFLDKIKHGKVFKALLMIVVIWFYALLTGLSPSVIRSAAMLSFIIIGKSLRRDADTLNILFASAFFILMFNPFLIVDVGFQLSYLAVAGIVLINEPISKWFIPGNFLIKNLWQTTAVSLSAQLITTPLSMLYFHQFPNYFLLTNVVVFVFAAVVMYAGIFVILVSFIPFISAVSAKILVYLVYGMNKSIAIIEDLPYSVSRGINLNLIECILLYILIFAVILLFFNKVKRYALIALSMVFLLFTSFTLKSYHELQQQKFIVYAIPKTSAYEFINGKQQLILADSSLMKDDTKFGFHIQNNHTLCGIHTKNIAPLNESTSNSSLMLLKHRQFIQFFKQRIAIVSEWKKMQDMAVKIKLDYLILSKNTKASIKDIVKVFDARMIIFDASNTQWKTEKWKKECIALHQAYYNVLESGAFVGEMELGIRN